MQNAMPLMPSSERQTISSTGRSSRAKAIRLLTPLQLVKNPKMIADSGNHGYQGREPEQVADGEADTHGCYGFEMPGRIRLAFQTLAVLGSKFVGRGSPGCPWATSIVSPLNR